MQGEHRLPILHAGLPGQRARGAFTRGPTVDESVGVGLHVMVMLRALGEQGLRASGLAMGTHLVHSPSSVTAPALHSHLAVGCVAVPVWRMYGMVGRRSARLSRTVLLHFHREWATRQHGGEKPLMRVAA